MSARIMFTVSRTLPDDRAAIEAENLRFLLQRAGWEVLSEACDPLEDPAPSTAQENSHAQEKPVAPGKCPRCHGVGRSSGISSPCGTCSGTGRV